MTRRVAGWRAYALALAGVALMSALVGTIVAATGIGQISILYLIVVLGAATRLGRGPAIVASLADFVIYDWSFTEPYRQLAIKEPGEWISLGLFLVTAIIASELAANERARAEQAERREREARLLFDALRLLSGSDLDDALRAVAGRLRSEMRLDGVLISLIVGTRRHEARVGAEASGLDDAEVLGTGGAYGARSGDARWIRVVRPGTRPRRSDRLRSEIPLGGGTGGAGRLTLIHRPAAVLTAEETRALAVIAGSLHAVAQRAELAEATTRAEVLRRADELKSALLAAVSHDLRTPLASIIASAASLRQPDVQWTEAERRTFAADIETEARRLARIVDNLLDLSRLESGAIRPQRDWYDVGAIVDDVVGRLRPLAVAHRVVVDVPEDLPPVYVDQVEIDQVVSNLVENALRHTPAGTTVRVRARTRDGALELDVEDDGPGLDPRDLSRLFQPFARGSRTGVRGGSGLGLAVARRLVEAHGGTLAAADAEGGGARFRVTLPALEPAAAVVSP